jgi:hypothetical protein
MNNELDPKTVAYLKRMGHSDRVISSFSKETRLLHDIGLCGDSAIEDLQILAKEFGVDFSGFDFDKHFPSELSSDAALLNAYRLSRLHRFLEFMSRPFRLDRRFEALKEKYKPITLGMIQDAIAKGKMVIDSEDPR